MILAVYYLFTLTNTSLSYMIDPVHGANGLFRGLKNTHNFNPHWYVVGQAKEFLTNKPKKIILDGSPTVSYTHLRAHET